MECTPVGTYVRTHVCNKLCTIVCLSLSLSLSLTHTHARARIVHAVVNDHVIYLKNASQEK